MGPTRGNVEWECNRRPRSEVGRNMELWPRMVPLRLQRTISPGYVFRKKGGRRKTGGARGALSPKWTGTAKSTVKSRKTMMPFHTRAQPSANGVISRNAFQYFSQRLTGFMTNIFACRAPRVAHAARGQLPKKGNKDIG
jgi:hypothetical protein